MLFRIKSNNGDSIAVPQIVFSKLNSAEEGNIRVALYLLATGISDPEQIARDLKLRSKQTAERALLWWAGAGLLERVDDTPVVPIETAAAPMTWQEIAVASRTDPMISGLIECVQTTFGCNLSHNELQKLVALYLQDAFQPDVIMLCVTYLASKEKRTIAALRHTLKAWESDGITNGEQADEYLKLLALREKREDFVAGLLGINTADFTQSMRKAIARWYEVYAFDDVMLSEAVLQAGTKKDVWYLNGILKSWHGKGLRNVHQVRGGGAVSNDGHNIRVDRVSPTENNFLSNAMTRPRRLKKKD
ncbi:MAG: DnaD domain protein [Faecalibacterium sp.]